MSERALAREERPQRCLDQDAGEMESERPIDALSSPSTQGLNNELDSLMLKLKDQLRKQEVASTTAITKLQEELKV